jgi:signal recognition particle subunit SRP54
MAGRILGMGDVVALVRETQRLVDEDERVRMEEKLRKGEVTLEDFRDQLEKFMKPGLMMKLLGLMGGPMKEVQKMMEGEDTEGGMKRMIGIINSMTPAERRNPKIIDPSRRLRIANGSGVQAHEVNQLVKQFDMMSPILKGMAGKGMDDRMRMVNEMQRSGMLNPGAKTAKIKKGTGKRLTPKERAKLRKERERTLRRRRRDERGKSETDARSAE